MLVLTKPTAQNSTLLQGFEWNVPADGKHWTRLREQLPALRKIGINNVWLPPGCKAASPEGNGYDIYDLWDLGEFNQKGAQRTKWGSMEDLEALARAAKDANIGLYWDAVLNHKAGADQTQKCTVVVVDPDDRTKDVTEPHEIEGWLRFEFEGRGGEYSNMKWHWYHFTGTDFDQATEKKAIYKIVGDNKGWSATVGTEQGNEYDLPDTHRG
jgi:alpha-amylase